MKPNLLVIVGPTAVGKTSLSLELAGEFHGEIISGDSMQVYRYMNIGTAKASKEERELVPHHLIDRYDPDYPFSVQEFQRIARESIAEVSGRSHLPILVGGTGLYVDSVTHNYLMPDVKENPSLRQELRELAEKEGNEALHRRLQEVDPTSAQKLHPNDQKRLIRALEVYDQTGQSISQLSKKGESPYRSLWIGLTMPRELLYERINLRVDLMIEQGLVEEVQLLRQKGYQRTATSMHAIGYKEIYRYLDGEWSLDAAIEQIKKGSRNYAKRQLSWFRRSNEILWYDVTKKGIFEEIKEQVAGKFPEYRE
ncbi:tRNA dimethylallyltransferase [Croceifilum oryzae]|uniref:tRNA dimethylallyltransferase n=1 Tax=Croceifilum oryzae TaxID=1553429 RepID=A0AAJ1WRH5_9BACL|nr:tRNA (adenosine(37)-N6)-dimethylallyltransferase MiaA [Croceifilum oryzae]MDQ0418527.1 tRNA dimethylallyltransferase [Croceifilum oryzae]